MGAVGSAASAGSLEYLLTPLPPQDSSAILVVLQHREALDEDRINRALAAMRSELAPMENDAPLAPGKLYLAPPQVIVTVEGGRFRVRATAQAVGRRGTIDSFLVSLAADQDGKTLVVALAGTDGDGTLGLKAVKQAGGHGAEWQQPPGRARRRPHACRALVGTQLHRAVQGWRDLSVERPQREGFGTELLGRTLAHELDAETRLAFEPQGLRCTIVLPLTQRIVARGVMLAKKDLEN